MPVWGWIVMLFLVVILVWNRKIIARQIMYVWWMSRPLTDGRLVSMHRYLMKRLRANGFKIDGRTPSELAKEVDAYYETNDMTRLTDLFEQVVYAEQEPNSKYKEYWKIMIRRIMS